MVIKSISWKSMIGIFIKKGYRIYQINVITAFLYRFLDEKIDIMQPTIFENGITRVWLWKKALYALKQFPQVWYQTLLDQLWKLNFYITEADYGLFISTDNIMFINVYIDDLLLVNADIDFQIDNFMQNL